jgi:ubiquinone/menaquinone biosynthesis C-methylase UbiE
MSVTSSAPVNHWPDDACARAFWGQHKIPPYRQLLADTLAWLDPQPGQHWLDLGCGCGQLTQSLWTKSTGKVGRIVALDCASVNERAIQKLQISLQPRPRAGQIRFVSSDFSAGLCDWRDGQFDGVVSGLAIQYAEHYSEAARCWTTEAYDRLLEEIWRVLRPNGPFVFSVNVPEPSWGKVAVHSWTGIFQTRQPGRYLKNALRMLRYGAWLSREARRGRFHYLPLALILSKLRHIGFTGIEHRLSFAGQAYLFRCRKSP